MTNDQIEWTAAEREAVSEAGGSPYTLRILDALAPFVAAREAQAAAKALREVAGEILAAVGPVVPHKGGSAGVYTNAPNGDSMALWSYGNAVAYTGATIEIVGLIDARVDRIERGAPMSDTPCVDGCSQDAATIERLRAEAAELMRSRDWWQATCSEWNRMAQQAWRDRDFNAAAAAEADALREQLAAVEALADEWERRAGETSPAWSIYGPQNVSVPFAVQQIRAALAPQNYPRSAADADQVSAPTEDAAGRETGECCASGRCEVCTPGYDWGES